MADWTKGMLRTYEFWRVDPATWGDAELIDTVTSCTITRDSDQETLGSASFEMDSWEGEMYVRTYLVTEQFGIRERWPLGTHLLQASENEFDGMRGVTRVEAHTPLKELLDDVPPIGYTINGGTVSNQAARLVGLHARMPVEESESNDPVVEPYVAEDSDTWLSYISGFLAKGREKLDLDNRGGAIIRPMQDPRSLRPTYTFDDSNSSIMQPVVRLSNDMADVPNVVQVVYSAEGATLSATAVNDAPSSASSTVSRGRRVAYRETSPELPDNPVQGDLDNLARKLLGEKGATTYEVSYTHGFVPDVVPGVAVRISYAAMDLDVVAVVVSQRIECTPSCQVSEVARFTA